MGKELVLSLKTPSGEGLSRVFWEGFLLYNDLVKAVLKIICTGRSTMSIVNSEIAAFGPVFDGRFAMRPSHVEDNADSVLIVIPLNALMRVGGVACDQTVGFTCKLRFLKIA